MKKPARFMTKSGTVHDYKQTTSGYLTTACGVGFCNYEGTYTDAHPTCKNCLRVAKGKSTVDKFKDRLNATPRSKPNPGGMSRLDPKVDTTLGIPQDEHKEYWGLWEVLLDAFYQAATGKGAERHSNGEAWEDQPIFTIPANLGDCGIGFLLGQAAKKIFESVKLPAKDAKERELLGAIVYLAAAVQLIRKGE